MSKWISLTSLLLVVPLGSCFVSPGDCKQQGVKVDPCVLGARPGQTLTLNATVSGAPGAAVNWEVSSATDDAFAIQPSGNRLTLISKQNSQGSFSVTARSQDNETLRGGAVISTSPAGFNSQPSPFVLVGDNFGVFKSAVAAGGGVYYVAYADGNAPFIAQLGPAPATNRFVKQFDLQTNVLLAEVTGQFEGFGSSGGNTIAPNVAADCAGNGYWIDDQCLDGCNGDYVLLKLAPGSSNRTVLYDFPSNISPRVDTLTVGCDGSIYYIADNFGQEATFLYKLPASGNEPIPIGVTGQPSFINAYSSLTVDSQGRLLAGDRTPGGFGSIGALVRLLLGPVVSGSITATVDTTFTPDLNLLGVGPIAVDVGGVIYATVDSGKGLDAIQALNELGDVVYTVSSYLRICPTGCTSTTTSTCNTLVPFENIQSLAASPGGALRVFDDVFIAGTDSAECDETFRLILINPQ